MSLTSLFVLDTVTGRVHEVGTDRHDSLGVKDGEVFYLNLHNGDCTLPNGRGGYVFVDSDCGDLEPQLDKEDREFLATVLEEPKRKNEEVKKHERQQLFN